ncbi:hypothetical protein P43SY_007629 [Pythium insidiosum]|uniref:Uncharacterized protein n=1 Tax=Pythium insidiosum TaxID=114742 RepID=A0AAD5M0D7_PYTIN|nr:hypothetical protein P43SY_007629 [Pythium insidiosum]
MSEYKVLFDWNMEDRVVQDPKRVVTYLVEALRSPAFKAPIKDQRSQAMFKPKRSSMQAFLMWLRPELEGFMKYEAHITNAPTGRQKNRGAPIAAQATVFQCPHVANAQESKTLYEKHTGKKVIKPVGAVAGRAGTRLPGIPCVVMDAVETTITPDSGAEISMVSPTLVNQLQEAGAWVPCQNLPEEPAVSGIGGGVWPVRKKVKLDLRF